MAEKMIKDYLTIDKSKILVSIGELKQEDLKFYPDNPRVYSALNSDGTSPSQKDIEEHMKKLEHVRQLADDIRANDGLIEEVIVKDGTFEVLEGNSRLAAYRILAEKDPVKWTMIKCKIVPSNISEDLIFKLIGQYHIKGKKPWDPYEQASFLNRRTKQTKMTIDQIADDLNLKSKSDAKHMVEAVQLMEKNSEYDNRRYSYYFEYAKNANIQKYNKEHPELEKVVMEQIKKGEIKEATDIRYIGDIIKVGDKDSKKVMKKYTDGKVDLYEAHDEMQNGGKLDSSVNKLKTFRTYINGDAFEKNVQSSEEIYKVARYEIDQIQKRFNQLIKKWDRK